MYNQTNILNISFQDPNYFIEKVNTLQKQLPYILDDFKKYFVLYNKDPNYPEYQNMFETVKSNLTTLSSSLFVISNDVDSNIEKVGILFNKIGELIKKEKQHNIKLKRSLGMVEQKANSSDEMIDNYNEMYDAEYLHNWGLVISILVAGVCISKSFSSSHISTA